MPGYVPPHLRGDKATPSAPPLGSSSSLRPPESSSSRGSSYGNFGGSRDSYAPQGGGSYYRGDGAGAGSSGRGGGGETGPLPPTFLDWAPTERIQKLTDSQIVEIRGRLNVTVDVGAGPPAPPPIESFLEMNLHPNIIADIKLHKYDIPTPIQAQGIPIALSGRDILGCAETGSGKTASFAIPMINHCLAQQPLRQRDGPIALVLAPTRELAQQIEKEVRAFSISSLRNVRSCIVVGGGSMQEQRHDLRAGVEVVVATPGRFRDHLQQGNTCLSRISFIVLDEADRMLDMGFEPQIKEVMTRLPLRHQTLLFSATMPMEIEGLAQAYLTSPVTIKVGAVSTPTANVSQALEKCEGDDKKLELLVDLLSEEMAQAQTGGPPMPLTVVFVERKNKCDDVVVALRSRHIPAAALHGGLGQGERECALRDFSAGAVKVLVATDVASRGLDIKGIGHVVNMDLPKNFEDYVHRIGRTGRAGTRGRATSFFSDRDLYVVTQIKQAIAEMEKGNQFAFAAGKAARQEERQLAQQFKSNLKMAGPSTVVQAGATAIKVDDKYAFMAAVQPSENQGAADAAWDD